MHNLLGEYKKTEFNYNNFIRNSEKVILNFRRSPTVEILDNSSNDDKYRIVFKDRDAGNTLCSNTISKNCWLSAIEKYYVNWNIQVFKNDKQIVDHNLNLENQKVSIVIDSKSVGDTIAWVPQIEQFQKIHKCDLYVSTFHNDLFRKSYPSLTFLEPNTSNDLKIKYEWWVGVYLDDVAPYHPIHWQTLPLYKIASDQLGIKDHKEIKCRIDTPPSTDFLKGEKYVCISNASTAGCKHWQYEGGWQIVVDHLNSLGYKVVLVQRERLPWMDLPELKNVIHPQIDTSTQAASIINNCEFMIGLSSGMSWLAWGLNKKVILISGFTSKFHEFSTPHRIINEDVCNSCWHDTNHKFDRGDWNWCPRDKKFECSTSIHPDKVIKEIDKLV